jgi:hypothetical protein
MVQAEDSHTKNIHTANEEEQAKTCRKLKEFLVIWLAVT